jgi:AraC-like DNA-binding protein
MDLHQRLTGLLADAERTAGLHITVHDRTGAFAGLIDGFHWHRHWFCVAGKPEHPDYGDRCQAHCRFALNGRCADPGCAPFVHTCWKSGSEAVAPVHRDGVHMLTLFGGVLRAGTAPPSGVIPEVSRAWRQLPPADPTRLAAAARVLAAIGQGMLTMLAEQPPAEGRRGMIDRLIEGRMHEALGPAQLGRHLGLSPSRAAHVVAGIYGMALGDLLRERRLARAQRLLVASDAAVGVIARRCGFVSQHWFNRLFTRNVGMPPARWRTAQRTGA